MLKCKSIIIGTSLQVVFTQMCHDFCFQCRSTGTNLSEHMKVYQKKKCCECGTKITITTLGEDNMRVTFFCPECQTNDLRKPHKL